MIQNLQIFSILTFVMTIAYEKYLVSFLNRAVKRSKKKGKGSDSTADAVYIPNDKERTHAIVSLINRLKIDLNSVDAAIGKSSFFNLIFAAIYKLFSSLFQSRGKLLDCLYLSPRH